MGFGLMLCGYFILVFMSFGTGEYSFAAYLVGGVISFMAAGRLYEYKHRFALTAVTSALWILRGLYGGLVCLDTLFLWGVPAFSGTDSLLVSSLDFGLTLLHTLFLLWGIYELARQVEVDSIRAGAVRNVMMVAVWATGQAVLVLFPSVAAFEDQTITKIIMLYQLVCYLFNAWLLFRCYQLICPVGEEMGRDRKPSRFAFVNRMHDKMDANVDRALEESLAYRENKNRKKSGQVNRTHKKKK